MVSGHCWERKGEGERRKAEEEGGPNHGTEQELGVFVVCACSATAVAVAVALALAHTNTSTPSHQR